MQKVLFILGQLNDDDVEWLIGQGVRRKVPRGERLIVQDESNDHLYIVLEGHVSVSVKGLGEVDVLGSGEILGEMSMVESRPPSATVTTLEDCYLLALPHAALRQHVQENLGFGMRFFRALAMFLSQRLRHERTPDFDSSIGLLHDQEQDGELDAYVLDSLQMAGARFQRLLRRLMDAPLEKP